MGDIQYTMYLKKLCEVMQLGEIISEPEVISGGLLHRMYSIETKQGKYVVKALNPLIMLRPKAMQNIINSERIANLASNHISALPAKISNGNSIQEIDGQFFLVFDWLNGASLNIDEIDLYHSEKIGEILASIHLTDFSELGIQNENEFSNRIVDWDFYLQKGKEAHSEWADLLLENIDELYEWTTLANESAKLLSSDLLISHRDLDPKNVLWIQDDPTIIDWESAGYVNPLHELIETACYWSEAEQGEIDKDRFLAFIRAYKKRVGSLRANWRVVLLNGFLGKLGWLEYNLKRSLWIECTDEEEQRMGTDQTIGTMNSIRHYALMIPELEKWLNNKSKK